MAFAAIIAFMIVGCTLSSCKKLEEEGMNEPNAYYSYGATTSDNKIKDVPPEFDNVIRNEIGSGPFQGGKDNDVIRVCDACYNRLKANRPEIRGSVRIIKRRHPDGKEKSLKTYKF